MISIKRIDFINYRIAGTCSLSFDELDNGYHMFGIVAENGTGKTTILNAITWCLYEEEYQLKDEETSLPIINSKKLYEMELNSSTTVSVRLTIEDDGKEIVFNRELKVIKSQDDKGVPCAILDTRSDFVVTVSDINSSEGSKDYYNEDSEFYVAEYFEKSIHDFFFFDGEKLEEFFTVNKASSIRTSIEAIAQIALLDTTIDNASNIGQNLSRKIAKNRPKLKQMEKELDLLKNGCLEDTMHLERSEKEVENLRLKKREIDAILKENSLSATLQTNKKLLDEKLKAINKKQDELYKKRVKFAIRSTILIRFYPMIIRALEKVEDRKIINGVSAPISKSKLIEIFREAQDTGASCPVCGSDFEQKQLLFIQHLIDKQTVDDDSAIQLKILKNELLKAKQEILNFKETNQKYSIEERDLQDEYSAVEKEYNEVSVRLSRLGTARDENGEIIDFSKLESESRRLESDIIKLDQAIGANRVVLEKRKRDYQKKQEEYDDGIKRVNDDEDTQKLIDTLRFIVGNLSSVKISITKEVREKIEEITRDIFMNVVWKKDTFGNIRIGEDYRLFLYDKYGQIMTGSSSATEFMILAYAYTLAIHKASGRNRPLVIDSPLGRVSGEIRRNAAEMLLETSCNKQIIMLFTKDEYSEQVKQLFEGKASMRTIILSDNESAWKEMEA